MSRTQRPGRRKSGLKSRLVDPHHWSSGFAQVEDKAEAVGPRVVVRFLEARNLLASDSYSGKSDPICFAFLGHRDDAPLLELFDDAVLSDCAKMTKVVPETVDPVWNEELVFTVGPGLTVQDLEEAWIAVLVRDEDIEEDEITYDELGMVRIRLRDIASSGKHMNHMCVCPPTWYALQKWGSMHKVAGQIKLAVSLTYGNDEHQTVLQTFAEKRRRKEQSNPIARELSRSPAKERRSMTDILKRVASTRRELSSSPPDRPATATPAPGASKRRTPIVDQRGGQATVTPEHETTELSADLSSNRQRGLGSSDYEAPEFAIAPSSADATSTGREVNNADNARFDDAAQEEEEKEEEEDNENPELQPPPPAPFAETVLAEVVEQQPELLHNEQHNVPRSSDTSDVTEAKEPHVPALPSKPAVPRMAAVANTIRTAHVLKRGRVDIDKHWVADLLGALDKLGDRSTERVGMGAALYLLLNPLPAGTDVGEAHMLQVLGAARKVLDSASVSLRKNIMSLLRWCMLLHATSCAGKTSSAALLNVVLRCIHNDTGASTLKNALSELCAAIPRTIRAECADFYEYAVSQLHSCLSEQSGSVQQMAAACLAALYHFPEPSAIVQVIPDSPGSSTIDTSHIRQLLGLSRPTTAAARRADTRQSPQLQQWAEIIDPTSGKAVAVLVEISPQEWPTARQRIDSSASKARFRFQVLAGSSHQHFHNARERHVQFIVNSGMQTLVEAMSQYVCRHQSNRMQASVGLLLVLQCVCESCSSCSSSSGNEPENGIRAVGQALSAHLSTVLPILVRALSHAERTWWKARSIAAVIVAALCRVEACHPRLYPAQAQLQSVLKALTSDQIAEVRQNAKLAAHALATLSNGEEGNVHGLDQPLPFDHAVGAGDQSSPGEATPPERNTTETNRPPQMMTTAASDTTNNESTADEGNVAFAVLTSPLEREPLDPTSFARHAGGNSTQTARMLKKLNTQTAALQSMVDDLTVQTRQSLEMLRQLTPKQSSEAHRDQTDISVASTTTADNAVNEAHRRSRSPRRHTASTQLQRQPPAHPACQPRKRRLQQTWQHVNTLLESGELNQAFKQTLASGSEKDIVQLMHRTGPCPGRLSNATREQLLLHTAGLIHRGASLSLTLPWVYQTVSQDCVQYLSPDTREAVANSLHQLAAVPTDQGVIAARLHRYFLVK